ncbi:sohB protein, peptidase U7 family [marine gamma proteobacterium HTCC2143]|uniref:SohB protein, peptidase U7 family n=1 Tax=marine gamma proteobacterium HTCC2143 TaxID=247633 RepID=A0YBD9_9GAMM|nr:sohB protein, peptidase U7 family [marine gamma proteobacterium HTCC2143]
MEFLSNYGLFLAKAVTIVVAVLFVVIGVVAAGGRHKKEVGGQIEVTFLNDEYDDHEHAIKSVILDEDQLKAEHKAEKKQQKAEKKQKKGELEDPKKRIYVLTFDGDVKASAVSSLREEITAILTVATADDEVVLCLESPGGMVHTYGLAASQLARITKQNIPLTVVVDAVAASGGYMMACIGNKILAAPFAVIGSIGVVAELPNFHRLLKKNDIDFELFTAGEHKRTVTMFGENTDKGKAKFVEELEDTHELFKSFVSEHRPQVNVAEVATGEVWYGQRAIENNLIDDIQTSDEYLMSKRSDSNIYRVSFETKKTLQEKLGFAAQSVTEGVVNKLVERFSSDHKF